VFRYDIAGRIVDVNDGRQVYDGGGITSYKYDRIGRATEVNDIYGRTIGYQYDKRGLRTKLDYPGITVYDVSYTYDCLGRVKAIYRYSTCIARYEYDELGRRTVKYGYSAETLTHYEYDLANRLTRLTNLCKSVLIRG
jgi:YD repeat-containing protein